MDSDTIVCSTPVLRRWTLRDAVVVGMVMFTGAIVGAFLAAFRAIPIPTWQHGTHFQQSQVSVIFVLAFELAATAAIVVFTCKLRSLGQPFSSIGWNPNRYVWLCVPIGLGFAAAISLLLSFTRLGVSRFADGFAPLSILLFLVLTAIAQPLIEEFYFRGVLFVALSERFRPFTTIVFTSIAFGLFHVGGYRFILVFVTLGGVLAFTRLKTQSVAACFALHAAYNVGILVVGLLTHH